MVEWLSVASHRRRIIDTDLMTPRVAFFGHYKGSSMTDSTDAGC
eukprot:COSAG02_NODE_55903_length_288_cov_0.761905_1_plen_43_part_01